MAVKIRLRRMGAKKAPFYRIVVAVQDTQETEDSLKRSVTMILQRTLQLLRLTLIRLRIGSQRDSAYRYCKGYPQERGSSLINGFYGRGETFSVSASVPKSVRRLIIMKDLLYAIAAGLVEDKTAIKITEDEPDAEGVIVFHLSVAPDDMGRVIGKQGRIAKALRTIMRAGAAKKTSRFLLLLNKQRDAAPGLR